MKIYAFVQNGRTDTDERAGKRFATNYVFGLHITGIYFISFYNNLEFYFN
jgi:hypothetical protein